MLHDLPHSRSAHFSMEQAPRCLEALNPPLSPGSRVLRLAHLPVDRGALLRREGAYEIQRIRSERFSEQVRVECAQRPCPSLDLREPALTEAERMATDSWLKVLSLWGQFESGPLRGPLKAA